MISQFIAGATLVLMAVTVNLTPARGDDACGKPVHLDVRNGESVSYSFREADGSTPRAALVLLAGGNGFIDLDTDGCARKLKGNTLVRNQMALIKAGFATALVDAPTDYQGEDGLGGFRAQREHADDLGAVIADMRARTGLPVYVIGISRGTISAANAASRLTGALAPDGVMLFSPVTLGLEGGLKAWVAQTVFDLPLQSIERPLTVVVHHNDKCVRTPPDLGSKIVERTTGTKGNLIVVRDGSDDRGSKRTVKDCIGKTPHGFVDQDDVVIKLISDFTSAYN